MVFLNYLTRSRYTATAAFIQSANIPSMRYYTINHDPYAAHSQTPANKQANNDVLPVQHDVSIRQSADLALDCQSRTGQFCIMRLQETESWYNELAYIREIITLSMLDRNIPKPFSINWLVITSHFKASFELN